MSLNNIQIKQLMGRYLKKFGFKSEFDLNDEEKLTYYNMEKALQGRSLTDDDARDFWSGVIEDINEKLTREGLSDKDRDFLLVELRLTRKIMGFIDGPEIQSRNAKIMIESQLQE